MIWFIFFITMLFCILVHEAGHLLASLFFKVKVNIFSIGFWKPSLGFKWKGIRWQITPFLLGGYCAIAGETTDEENGLLVQPYFKKAIIILAGVFVNLIVAFICYWINYKNIWIGIYIDWIAMKSVFIDNYDNLINLVIFYKPNLILLQLSMLNLFLCITNLIPFPALDGSMLILYLMKPIWKKNYVRNLQIVTKVGFWSLMILQGIFLIWLWLK